MPTLSRHQVAELTRMEREIAAAMDAAYTFGTVADVIPVDRIAQAAKEAVERWASDFGASK